MAKDRDSRREFERMVLRHKGAIERAERSVRQVRLRLDTRLEVLRKERHLVQIEIKSAVDRGIDPLAIARKYRDRRGVWPEMPLRKRRRRGDDLDGGDPVPVEPRPNPKPLMDGAEAPVE